MPEIFAAGDATGISMAARMDVRQIAELELAFPTFTEAIGIAARRIVRTLGLQPAEWEGGHGLDAAA